MPLPFTAEEWMSDRLFCNALKELGTTQVYTNTRVHVENMFVPKYFKGNLDYDANEHLRKKVPTLSQTQPSRSRAYKEEWHERDDVYFENIGGGHRVKVHDKTPFDPTRCGEFDPPFRSCGRCSCVHQTFNNNTKRH